MISTAISEGRWGAGFPPWTANAMREIILENCPSLQSCACICGAPLCGSYPKYTARCCQGQEGSALHSCMGTQKACGTAGTAQGLRLLGPRQRRRGGCSLPLSALVAAAAGAGRQSPSRGATCPWWRGRDGQCPAAPAPGACGGLG